jgi:signal transduction histidine kinase
VRADELRLRQIVLNLLSNAVKFTPAGGTVGVEIRRDAEGVRIAVTDTGLGIAEDDLATVLQPFVQLDRVGTSRYEGTGLGLSLTQHLVALHGGRLAITSAVGKGTTATVLLPPERIIDLPSGAA